MSQLTVLISCKNERMNIRPCIDSARLVADEILVADSGSTDGTIDIVKQIGGCRLIQREFVTYYDFKNWAIPQASHPWILVVDADERVTPELAAEIRQVIKSAPPEIDGYWVPNRTFFMGHELRYSGYNTIAPLRLVRRDRCRYSACRVHEGFSVDRKRTLKLKSRMLHYTYWSYDQYFDKYLRYTKWGAQDKWDRGDRTNALKLLLKPFLRFLQLYILRRGFLDGMIGIQSCIMQSFFVTFVKQARLWEMEHARTQPDPEAERQPQATRSAA